MQLPVPLLGALLSLTVGLGAATWGLVSNFAAGGIEVTGPTVASGFGVGTLAGGYVYIFKKFLNGEWVVRDVAKAETEANQRVDKLAVMVSQSHEREESYEIQSEAHRELIREMVEKFMDQERRRVDKGHTPERRKAAPRKR